MREEVEGGVREVESNRGRTLPKLFSSSSPHERNQARSSRGVMHSWMTSFYAFSVSHTLSVSRQAQLYCNEDLLMFSLAPCRVFYDNSALVICTNFDSLPISCFAPRTGRRRQLEFMYVNGR